MYSEKACENIGPRTFFQSAGALAAEVTFLPNSSSTNGFPIRLHASAWLLIHWVRNAWFSLPVCTREQRGSLQCKRQRKGQLLRVAPVKHSALATRAEGDEDQSAFWGTFYASLPLGVSAWAFC